jgi:hypothetical protein
MCAVQLYEYPPIQFGKGNYRPRGEGIDSSCSTELSGYSGGWGSEYEQDDGRAFERRDFDLSGWGERGSFARLPAYAVRLRVPKQGRLGDRKGPVPHQLPSCSEFRTF